MKPPKKRRKLSFRHSLNCFSDKKVRWILLFLLAVHAVGHAQHDVWQLGMI